MDRQQWLEWRRKGLGSSDAAVIMGVSPWKTKYELWNEKVNGISETEDNASMKRGRELEPMIREKLEENCGEFLLPKNVVHSKLEWLRASLDATTFDGRLIFEIKTANAKDHQTAKAGSVPKKYVPQLVHQSLVTGNSKIHYVSFHTEDLTIVKCEIDKHDIEELYEAENSFWNDHVLTRIPPEKTDEDYKKEKAKHLKEYSCTWIDAAHEWRAVKERIDLLQGKEQSLRETLIRLSGGRNVEGGGIRLTQSEVQGRIDYERFIDEIASDNRDQLERFRKPSTTKFTINIMEL